MGKESSAPSINVPNPPNFKKSYKQGVNVYLKYLDRFLNREMQMRNRYDPQRIAEQQGLQDRFGPTQYRQMLDALRAIDPTGYALREQTGNAISRDLSAGTHLTDDQQQELEQEVRRSQAARGNTYGQAPVQAESFTKGRYGQQLYQQRLMNSLNFQNAATPESWLQMIPPVSADRSMAYVNPNAGFQGAQYDMQNYQNLLGAATANASGGGGGGNSWMSTIGQIAQIAGPIIGMAFSDKRLKTAIKAVGSIKGTKMYEYEYKGEPGVKRIGPMAQDVEKKNPDAVIKDPASGFRIVDFRKLGLPLPLPVS